MSQGCIMTLELHKNLLTLDPKEKQYQYSVLDYIKLKMK
ncbi:MAG: hypothetical protein FD166_1207 [Bacteroidetes bacterium]|nr:MAG: hypothetical protein FD166_1207 [Bacteroidota bacterium]